MNAVATPLDELFDGVDDLIKRVADTENPEIRKMRARVHASMAVAKSAFADGGAEPRPTVFEPVAGQYFEDDPRDTLGIALLVGVGLGVIMAP